MYFIYINGFLFINPACFYYFKHYFQWISIVEQRLYPLIKQYLISSTGLNINKSYVPASRQNKVTIKKINRASTEIWVSTKNYMLELTFLFLFNFLHSEIYISLAQTKTSYLLKKNVPPNFEMTKFFNVLPSGTIIKGKVQRFIKKNQHFKKICNKSLHFNFDEQPE